MEHPASTLSNRGAEHSPSPLEKLPTEILCLILEQSDSISDLIIATHACPALFRVRNLFEKQIVFATLCNQFEPAELLPMHLAYTLPRLEVFNMDDFKEMMEIVRSSRPQNAEGLISRIKPRMSLFLGHNIEAFHKTLTQLTDRYFNGGPASPFDLEEVEFAAWVSIKFLQPNEGLSRECHSAHSQVPDEAQITQMERLRFLHALCNLEIVRKLVGGRWPDIDPAQNHFWRHCVREMKTVFSINDWAKMNSVISFIDDYTQPCYDAMFTRVERESLPATEPSDLYCRLAIIVVQYDVAGGLTPEFFYAVSLGLETCLDMIENPDSPKHLHLLVSHEDDSLQRHQYLFGLINEVMAVDDSFPLFSPKGHWDNLLDNQLALQLRPNEPEWTWNFISSHYPRFHHVRAFLACTFEVAEVSELFFATQTGLGGRARCRCRRGNNW